MYSDFAGDPCPRCGSLQMPPLVPGSVAGARQCQSCRYTQELDPGTGRPVPDATPRLSEGE